MMNLDEAIKYCEEVAKEKRIEANYRIPPKADCLKCAEEYEQMAFWLKDYKRLKEAEALDIEREQREEAKRESHKIDDNEDTLKFRGHA